MTTSVHSNTLCIRAVGEFWALKPMIRAISAMFVLVCSQVAGGDDFPITPPSEKTHVANSTAPEKLSFCIVDYGDPGIWGRPTNFWVSASGHVFTQRFEIAKDSKAQETRYEYDLTDGELKRLQSLLHILRADERVLKERYAHPDEPWPTIAFALFPHSDLYVRDKRLGDLWKNFSAVTRYLEDLDTAKIRSLKPTYSAVWNSGQALWEPDAFISLKTINSLLYAGSPPYDLMLEKQQKSEQPGGGKTPKTSQSHR